MSFHAIARISLLLAALLSVVHVSSAFSRSGSGSGSSSTTYHRRTATSGLTGAGTGAGTAMHVISTLARTAPGPRIGSGAPTRSVPLRMSAEDEAERLRAQAAKLREEVAEATGSTSKSALAAAELEAEAEQQTGTSTVQLNADGTVYDDETPEYRDPLSDSMRARLMKEASTGLDSNQKQTNVILYISIAVAVLVLLGGQGILY